jgi:hypothetical protein
VADEKQRASVSKLFNIFREGFPRTKLGVNCSLAYFQYLLLDMDNNNMQTISLKVNEESNIPILTTLLANPRPGGQQWVMIIHIHPSSNPTLASDLLDAIKMVEKPSIYLTL